MEATAKMEIGQPEAVMIDVEGNVVVNKDSQMSSKLVARRAIEAHLERKRMEKVLDSYYDFDDL